MYIAGMDARRFPAQLPRFLRHQFPVLARGMLAEIDKAFHESATKPGAYLLQLGAFDGHFDDPVRPYIEQYHLPALLIEPQLEPFRQLERRYRRNSGICLGRYALAESEGPVLLYTRGHGSERFWGANTTTDPEQLKRAVRGHWLSAATSGTTTRTEVVEGLPLDSILKKHEVDPKDLTMVVTDIEGSDVLAMQQLFETDADPQLIQYEHLRAMHADTQTIEKELGARGYQLFTTYKDTIAFKG